MNSSRREALAGIGGLAIATAASTLFAENTKEKPWDYKKLNPEIVAARAYKGYHKHGCMYATFEAIIGELGDKFGLPCSNFPSEMMQYGAAGVAG